MIFHDINQNTDEWDALRAGKITSSSMAKVMANYGKAFGEPAKQYAVNIAVEQMTGRNISSGYSNPHMERGHIDEPIARMEYEAQYFTDVLNGGFYEDGDLGCSPDGRTVDNGAVEIKSHLPHIHYSIIKRGTFEPAYKWQLLCNMKIPGFDYIDYISYCGSFPDESKIFVSRLYAEDYKKEFSMIDARLAEFRELISSIKNTIGAHR